MNYMVINKKTFIRSIWSKFRRVVTTEKDLRCIECIFPHLFWVMNRPNKMNKTWDTNLYPTHVGF